MVAKEISCPCNRDILHYGNDDIMQKQIFYV